MAEHPAEAAASEQAPAPADPRSASIAAIIRNGLSNGPISRSQATWDHLNQRLDDIVEAILKEV